MNWTRSKSPTTVLGLALDAGRLDAVVLRRTNGSAEVQKHISTALTLNPMRDEPELVGREIRNALDAAGIKERRCVAGVPLHWALTLDTKLPDLAGDDVESFLQLEAERGFPRGTDELQIAVSRHDSPGGAHYATQIGVPRDYLNRLEQVLTAAQLKPLSFSLAIAALPGAVIGGSRGTITAFVGENAVELLVSSGGGVVALRSLEGAFDSEGGEKRVQTDLIARELRITLGQLPPDIRDALQKVQIIGGGRFAQQLAAEIQLRAAALGLAVEHVAACTGPQHGLNIAGGAALSPALGLAARFLAGRGMGFEFLPPKPSLFQQLAERYSSKRLVYAGATAGAVAFLVCGLFLYQQVQLSILGSKWAAMKPKAGELDGIQAQIRKFRPWFDDSLASLSILRRVTDAFPEDGVVSAKTIEIRNSAAVSLTGTARDNPALLKTLDQLRAAKEVRDVKVEQIRGKTPMQFTFNFHWGESAAKP